MDILTPFLPRISNLEVDHRGPFYIAGLKDQQVQRVRLFHPAFKEKRYDVLTGEGKKKKDTYTDDEGKEHLDTWA